LGKEIKTQRFGYIEKEKAKAKAKILKG